MTRTGASLWINRGGSAAQEAHSTLIFKIIGGAGRFNGLSGILTFTGALRWSCSGEAFSSQMRRTCHVTKLPRSFGWNAKGEIVEENLFYGLMGMLK